MTWLLHAKDTDIANSQPTLIRQYFSLFWSTVPTANFWFYYIRTLLFFLICCSPVLNSQLFELLLSRHSTTVLYSCGRPVVLKGSTQITNNCHHYSHNQQTAKKKILYIVLKDNNTFLLFSAPYLDNFLSNKVAAKHW